MMLAITVALGLPGEVARALGRARALWEGSLAQSMQHGAPLIAQRLLAELERGLRL